MPAQLLQGDHVVTRSVAVERSDWLRPKYLLAVLLAADMVRQIQELMRSRRLRAARLTGD